MSFLNTYINKKPFFLSQVVTNMKDHPFPCGLISWAEGSATYLRDSNIDFWQSLKFGETELLTTNSSFIH